MRQTVTAISLITVGASQRLEYYGDETRCRPNGTYHYWPAACCPLVSYVAPPWSVTDDDRRQTPATVTSLAPTLYVGRPLINKKKLSSPFYEWAINDFRMKHVDNVVVSHTVSTHSSIHRQSSKVARQNTDASGTETSSFARVLLAVVGEVVQLGGVRQPHLLLFRLDVGQRMTDVGGADGRDVVERFGGQVRGHVRLHARSHRRRATVVRRPIAGQAVERVSWRLVDIHLMTELGWQVPALVCHWRHASYTRVRINHIQCRWN